MEVYRNNKDSNTIPYHTIVVPASSLCRGDTIVGPYIMHSDPKYPFVKPQRRMNVQGHASLVNTVYVSSYASKSVRLSGRK